MNKLAPREQRIERAELLRKERSLLADLIKSGNAEGSHYTRFQSVDDELTQLDRINRGEFDVMYFALEYFSDDGNPDNDENLIPAGVNYDNSAEFHHELCGLLNDIASGKQRDHVAWACLDSTRKQPIYRIYFLRTKLYIAIKRILYLYRKQPMLRGISYRGRNIS